MTEYNEQEKLAYNSAIEDAINVINDARDEGESDLRQVRSWIEDLLIEETP